MSLHYVSIAHSVSVIVAIEADSPEAAFNAVSRYDYPLPALENWSDLDDWSYRVTDEDDNILFESD